MKRSWFGFFLLLLLLAGSFSVTVTMEKIHQEPVQALLQAAQHSEDHRWEAASAALNRARGQWEATEHLRRCFADHTPVEEIAAGFARLSALSPEDDPAEFAATCRELATKAAAIADAHRLNLRNLL